jgi:hypothetical protein
MKNYFDLIVLIQSYPNLIHALNYALNNCDKKVLILINGDRNIFKFVNNIIKHENITTQIYGNNIFLTSRIFSWLLPIYVIYLNFRIPTFESNKKLITYSNWCNIGALFHFKTKSKIVSNLIAYQEERYTIQGIGTKNLPLYITILNFFTNDMLERKRYIYEEDGQTKSVESHSYGIRKRINISATIHAPREGEYSLIKESIKDESMPFILYIEKNLLKTKAISFFNFIKLNLSIYRLGEKNNITIGVKFKPRDRYFFRKYFYRILGFKILPSYIPVQLFCIQDNCKYIIGFSSSSMAENYDKPVFCFGSINDLFNSSVYGNINSLRQRSVNSDFIIFLEERIDLENLS